MAKINKAICPYCNHESDMDYDGTYGYDEAVRHRKLCSACGKTHLYRVHVTVEFRTVQADCLNGGEHSFIKDSAYPDPIRLKCKVCGDEKTPGSQEALF